jgi:hypothetical protein
VRQPRPDGQRIQVGQRHRPERRHRSTDGAVRSKGTLYLALHQHGTYAWGRWVGMSYDGPVVTGWGAIARTEEQVHQVVVDLIKSEPS